MLYSKILVPYDNSEAAHEALLEAVRFAQEDGSIELRIINIIDVEKRAREVVEEQQKNGGEPAYAPKDAGKLYDDIVAEADALLHGNIDAALADLDNDIVIEMLEETVPGNQILTYSTQNEVELIIMGSRGLGAIRGLLGSVSNHVLRESEIPVLIVR